MDSLKAALNVLVTQVAKSVGVYTAVIGIYFYHVVFDKDFECTCKVQAKLCWLYMVLPAFMILVMLLWLDGSFQAFLKYTCRNCTGRFCCALWSCIIRAIFIGLLWPISVLMDGDWYTCCWHEKNLYCRESNQTAGDEMTIKELRNKSRIYGFGALLGIVFVAAIFWSIPLKGKCCCCESKCCNKDAVFKRIVLEEGENVVTNRLIEAAKEKLNEKLDSYVAAKEWGKCYDVVKELIDQPPPDELPSESSPNVATTSF